MSPSIEQLANTIARLHSDDQARLISALAEITQDPNNYSLDNQLHYITNDKSLSSGGRKLMAQIGAYAQPRLSGEVEG